MMHLFRIACTCLLIIFIPGLINAQNLSFAYDLAGNRIEREIIISSDHLQNKKKAVNNPKSEMISDKTIRIYPNPTKGNLKIEIEGWDESDICKISIYDSNGIKFISSEMETSFLNIDLSLGTKGIYLMHIILNGNESIWKIIKD